MPLRRNLLLGTIAMLAAVSAAVSVAWACAPNPQLTLSSSQGPAGSKVTVSGTEWQPINEIEIRWNSTSGTPIASKLSDATGSFSVEITIPTGAAPGDYVVRADHSGAHAGHPGKSAPFRVTDTTAPETTVDDGPTGVTSNKSPSFSFSSSEPTGATFQCKLDGPGASTGSYESCSSPKAYSNLADGSYTFSAKAKDAAGNEDMTPATRTFTVDTTPPDPGPGQAATPITGQPPPRTGSGPPAPPIVGNADRARRARANRAKAIASCKKKYRAKRASSASKKRRVAKKRAACIKAANKKYRLSRAASFTSPVHPFV